MNAPTAATGYRTEAWDTQTGTIDLAVAKLREAATSPTGYALTHKVREGGRIVNVACVIATGVSSTG